MDEPISDLPKQENKDVRGSNLIPTIILLGFLAGLGGSIVGARFLGPLYGNNLPGGDGVTTIDVDEQSAVVEVVKKASPAVVSIIISKDLNKIPGYSSFPFDSSPFSFDPFFDNRNPEASPNIQQVGSGTGFIIASDGLIVTNKHVVNDENASYTVFTNDGKQFNARVLSRDPVNDLALVKVEGNNFPTLPLGDSSDLDIGQKVIAIGNSLGQYRNTVTTGVVSGIGRSITAGGVGLGSEQLEGVIQTDAAINPGNSGGPLLDIGGSVIGINTAIDAEGQLVGFAIPVNDAKKDLESFQKFGRIIKPFLGVRYVLVNDAIKEQNNLTVNYGALIVSGSRNAPPVVPGSAAEKAGLKENDVILEVNSIRIDKDHSLAGILKDYNPGDVIKLKVLSNNQEKEISVTLGETK